ncbi:MAG: heavy metal translocating P-type ATPase metal-binding domain-containing protein [Verrucomicrobiales bacterium]
MTAAAHPAPNAASVRPGEARRCRHCGNSFEPRFEEEHFCCSGCRVVHDLIRSSGFDSFYELLGGKTLEPADAPPLPDDLAVRLGEAIGNAEAERSSGDSPAKLTLRVGNLSCTACVWLIDHLYRQQDGALKISADTTRSTLALWWTPGEFDVPAFVRELHRFGYPVAPLDEDDDELPCQSQALVTRLGVTAGLAMNTMAFTLPSYLGMEPDDQLARLFALVAFASASLALAVGGSYFFHRAWSALKAKTLHMDVPISLGLAAAYLGSLAGMAFDIEGMLYFDFVATFAFLMIGGRWLHLRILDRNRQHLRARERDLTTVYRLEKDGGKKRIDLRKIQAWEALEIPTGAIVPTTGQLIDKAARFHLDWINGEPEPVVFHGGQKVPAGARNGTSGPVRLITREAFAGTLLERLLFQSENDDLVESPDGTVHRILGIYLFSVLAVALTGGAAWMLAGRGAAASLQVLISVLVVSCPCALGLALPLLDEMVLSKLKRQGIFLRRHSLWGRLRRIETLVFDKTGTLTEPVKRLTNPEALEGLSPKGLAALRHLTATNAHPVGKALHDVVASRFGDAGDLPRAAIREHPGKGVSCDFDGCEWRLGRDDWAVPKGSDSGACTLSRDGAPMARFRIEETVRDGAIEQLRALRRRNFQLRLFSGDPDAERVGRTARILGLSAGEVRFDLSPEEKAELVAAEPKRSVLFVGDGGNDSLAFGAAAACGTPATGVRALESRADFVFTGRGFHAIGQLLDAARRRRRLVAVIFTAALVYNVVAVGLCLAGMMNPLLAAVLMPASSILTTAIAARG